MDAIIHIGPAKTGTTALQRGLLAARSGMLAKGVLFPALSARKGRGNHRPLVPYIFPDRLPPRGLRKLDSARLDRIAKSALEETCDQISVQRPACLLLSSEQFFNTIGPGTWEGLFDRLPVAISGRLTFSCYIRRPSEHYLSRLQQGLKGSHTIRPPVPQDLRKVLESYRTHLPHAHLSVRPFARRQMTGGDIVTDFAAHHLAEYGLAEAIPPRAGEVNQTLSGEAMAVLRAYRMEFHADEDNLFHTGSSQLSKLMLSLDAELGLARPRLRPEIADRIDYSSDQARWFLDEYGIEFDGYDYARAGTLQPEPPPDDITLSDVIEIDAGGLDRLIRRLRRTGWALRAPRRTFWLAGLARQAQALAGG